MLNKKQIINPIEKNQLTHFLEGTNFDDVLKFKKRMLEWPNPVEYVNNMYGCHPDNDDNEYFRMIFSK